MIKTHRDWIITWGAIVDTITTCISNIQIWHSQTYLDWLCQNRCFEQKINSIITVKGYKKSNEQCNNFNKGECKYSYRWCNYIYTCNKWKKVSHRKKHLYHQMIGLLVNIPSSFKDWIKLTFPAALPIYHMSTTVWLGLHYIMLLTNILCWWKYRSNYSKLFWCIMWVCHQYKLVAAATSNKSIPLILTS